MRRRDQWIERMRSVERESEVAAYALELLDERLQQEPSSLKSRGLERRDADRVTANRDARYLVRAFVVFESGLRDAWRHVERRTTNPVVKDLLQAFASKTRMPSDRVRDVDLVRAYRNSVVHDVTEAAEPVSLTEARRFLCRYFSFLPPDW